MTEKILLILLAIINIVAFVMYGVDKYRAIRKQWRIPEKTLIGIAVIGGSVGALLGMFVFRHKTKHWKFIIGVPAILVLQIVAIAYFAPADWQNFRKISDFAASFVKKYSYENFDY